MSPCPHGGAETKEAQSVCANCGAGLKAIWPPPPAGIEEERAVDAVPPSDDTACNGFGCGCLLSLLSTPIFLLLTILWSGLEHGATGRYLVLLAEFALTAGGWLGMMLLLYLRQRPKRPRFARGFAYNLLFLLIFLVCISLFCGVL